MSKLVGVMNFQTECSRLLSQYGKDARIALNDSLPEAAKIAVKMILGNSKKASWRYAKGWTSKAETFRGIGTTYVVYNKDRYRVAHLLENPHKIKNKRGEYGKTTGDHVIADAETYTTEWLIQDVEKRIKNL